MFLKKIIIKEAFEKYKLLAVSEAVELLMVTWLKQIVDILVLWQIWNYRELVQEQTPYDEMISNVNIL